MNIAQVDFVWCLRMVEKLVEILSKTKAYCFGFLFSGMLAPFLFFSFSAADNFKLSLPADCRPGINCFLQNYVDIDPGPKARDFTCGHATYNGHKGTDFRLAALEDITKNVKVLAAAPGDVVAIRDNIVDRLLTEKNKSQVKGLECGNGLIIRHDGGWETQYCHLRRGSLQVTKGQKVAAGAVLGTIGNSGFSTFPHLHLTLRKNGVPIDPFTGQAADGQCGKKSQHSLWNEATAKRLKLPQSEIIDMGFSPTKVTRQMALIRSNRGIKPHDSWKALVFYGVAIKLRAKDRQIISLTSPDGKTTVNKMPPLDRPKANYVLFAGRKRPHTGWPKGTYKGRYQLLRDGQVIIDRELSRALAR